MEFWLILVAGKVVVVVAGVVILVAVVRVVFLVDLALERRLRKRTRGL